SITGSTIFAGVADGGGGDLPTGTSSFVNLSPTRTVTRRTRAPTVALADSNIAASGIGRVNLGTVQVTNGGDAFGLAALVVKSLSAVRNDNATPVKAANLTDPSQSLDLVDFEVRIF